MVFVQGKPELQQKQSQAAAQKHNTIASVYTQRKPQRFCLSQFDLLNEAEASEDLQLIVRQADSVLEKE